MARACARRLDIDPERVWDVGVSGLLVALVAPRLILILANWSDFVAHPLWLIGVFSVRSQPAVIAGLVLAIATMATFVFLSRLPFRRTLDALAPALALGFSISSIGAFMAGSEFGTPTGLPLAVTFHARLAWLWYRTPLETPLHPVQLYAAMVEFCLFAWLTAIIAMRDRRRQRYGEIMGTWLFLHGLSFFGLNFLRGDLTASSFAGAQIFAACMVFAGGLLWL